MREVIQVLVGERQIGDGEETFPTNASDPFAHPLARTRIAGPGFDQVMAGLVPMKTLASSQNRQPLPQAKLHRVSK